MSFIISAPFYFRYIAFCIELYIRFKKNGTLTKRDLKEVWEKVHWHFYTTF
jgi:hypothetical protein